MSEELKPCPFCGKPAEHDSQHWNGRSVTDKFNTGHAIYCSDQHCAGSPSFSWVFDTFESAKDHWNTRAESPELTTLREQVRKLTEERDKARDDADVRQGQILALREQADHDRSDLTSAKQDAEEQAQLADGLMKDLSSAKQQIEELTRERDVARRVGLVKVAEQARRIVSLISERDALAARCAELESEAARLREDGAMLERDDAIKKGAKAEEIISEIHRTKRLNERS